MTGDELLNAIRVAGDRLPAVATAWGDEIAPQASATRAYAPFQPLAWIEESPTVGKVRVEPIYGAASGHGAVEFLGSTITILREGAE